MKVHDEVCGMTIDAGTAAASTLFQGTRYHFCSERCRRLFGEHPEWYIEVTADSAPNPPGSSGE
ncbi:MAG: YHS domain-containing protein [Gemmatimonadota bacterium]|nr:YHS domain-containing protein [Gemmatimonadota bacterium]MDE3005045.1 YHS domain-containing protein [Gemmatimonadota bacterium]